jgi:dipeptidyl aminopeptidase/acylaminoacyl peptidase
MRSHTLAPLVSFLTLLAAPAAAQTKLLRFPDIHGDRIAFCYAGDLWTAPAKGGTATRLTAHEGLELFPKFSPDGQWIAFTGQYDGDEQVYVVPATGGVPKQLTWYPTRGPLPSRWGYDDQVYGWTKDSKRVLFRAMRDGWSYAETHLYTVDLEGGLPVKLPMPTSGGGDLSPGESQVVYSPLARDFRTWKRYEGGWAQDLFIYDLKTAKIEPVANSPRTERDPMWIGNQIVFASDRDGTLNLYAYDIESKRDRGADEEQGLGRALAEQGGGRRDRVRGRRGAARLRHALEEGRPGPDPRPERRRRDAAFAGLRGGPDRGLRALAEGRARARGRARGRVHGADREGADAEPDALVGRARPRGGVVARRGQGRVHLRLVR